MELHCQPRLNRRAIACAGVSVLLILPVLLQLHVQAGDLASHLYNTWLVLLVKAGEPLGLEIVPQYSNVLFDWWLEGLWRLGGPVLAEKAAVSLAVLLFFWGAFFLLSRLTGRSAWPSAPLLAMMAYGWVYHQGFFNYYLSCAFGFWAIGLAVSGGRQALAAAPLLAAAATGHLVGAAAAAGFCVYLLILRRIQPRSRKWLLGAAVLALAGVAGAIAAFLPSSWHTSSLLHLSGGTVFWVYGAKYAIPSLLVVSYWAWALLAAGQERNPNGPSYPAAPHLAALSAAALVTLPASLHWPGTQHFLHFIDWRLAVWLALLLHCGLVRRVPARWTMAACSTAAALYFFLLAADWRALGKAEISFHQAARKAPARARVVSEATALPLGMNPLLHMIDRACIGHCFSYANYEPASAQFRLRVLPGSPVVLDSSQLVSSLQAGEYTVQPRDLPLFAIFPADAPRGSLHLHVRPLQQGEQIRRVRVTVPPQWF